MLDYRGQIGLQYNPIAIAQYGLGNYNLFVQENSEERRRKFLAAADWLAREPRAERSRSLGVEPSFRLGISGYAEGALVFGSCTRAGRFRCWFVRITPRRIPNTTWRAGRAFESLTRSVDEGGVFFTGRAWRCVDRRVPRGSSHAYFEWDDLGAVGSSSTTRLPRAIRSAKDLFNNVVRTLDRNLSNIRCRVLVAVRAVGNSPADDRESLLPSLAHCAVAHHAPADGHAVFRRLCRALGEICAEPDQAHRSLCYKSAFKLCYY